MYKYCSILTVCVNLELVRESTRNMRSTTRRTPRQPHWNPRLAADSTTSGQPSIGVANRRSIEHWRPRNRHSLLQSRRLPKSPRRGQTNRMDSIKRPAEIHSISRVHKLPKYSSYITAALSASETTAANDND